MILYKKLFEILTLQERWQIPMLIVLTCLATAFEIMSIGMIIPVIAILIKPNLGASYPFLVHWLNIFGNPSREQLVIGGVLLLICIYSIKTVFLIYMSWKQSKFICDIQANISRRLFRGYLLQPWSFHLQRNSAQLILNATQEVNLFVVYALQPSITILTEGLVLLGISALWFVVQPIGTFVTMSIFGIAGVLSQRLVRGPLLRWGKARQHHEGLRIQHLQQGLGGAKDVKILGREYEFFVQYELHNLGSSRTAIKQKMLMELPKLWLELLAIVSLATLIILMIVQGRSMEALIVTIGVFVAGAFRMILVSNRLLTSFQGLRYALPIINTLHEEIQLVGEDVIPKNKNSFLLSKNITLENISYSYTNQTKPAINDISLSIPVGASIGFVGVSGAGKSTLIDIILGLLSPNKGQVKIDAIDIQTNLRGWQSQIGYVPQTIFLTDDTLRRNIAFGLSEDKIDDICVLKAIKLAQLDEFVNGLPEGVETLVGERGVRLSGGQRQRIGIARALYHDPAVLVLDEATSALDTVTEKGVMDAVYALPGNKTILIVAHRLTTVAQCDLIYRMNQGNIIVTENHEAPTTENLGVVS